MSLLAFYPTYGCLSRQPVVTIIDGLFVNGESALCRGEVADSQAVATPPVGNRSIETSFVYWSLWSDSVSAMVNNCRERFSNQFPLVLDAVANQEKRMSHLSFTRGCESAIIALVDRMYVSVTEVIMQKNLSTEVDTFKRDFNCNSCQRERTSFTPKGSLVRIQYRPPDSPKSGHSEIRVTASFVLASLPNLTRSALPLRCGYRCIYHLRGETRVPSNRCIRRSALL